MSYVKITLIKSLIGTKQDHRATVRGLGLRRLKSTSTVLQTPAITGMIDKVSYLLRIEYNATK